MLNLVPFALAAAVLAAAAPASAAATLADYRRAVACTAITDKFARENERGLETFLVAARRDPKMADKLGPLETEQRGLIKMKQGIANTLRTRAAAMLAAGYGSWAGTERLPPAAELERAETAAAAKAAAKARNVADLSKMMDPLRCEDFLVAG
jgi:hypothetical protein